MRTNRQDIRTWTFIGMLLAAGIANLLAWSPYLFQNTLWTCVSFMIYTGLLLSWILSLFERLLPTRARTYMVAAAVLMTAFLFLRVYKYRIAQSPVLERYLIYAYYIPIALIPALFLTVCICIRQGERTAGKPDERAVLLPAAVLAVLFMTNDLHHLVYIPDIPGETFAVVSGTYHYGPVFFLLYGWIVISIAAGLFLLLRMSNRISTKKMAAVLGVLPVWAVLLLLCNLLSSRVLPSPYKMPEVHIFCMLSLFESCIRNHLIPSNENYAGFFAGVSLPAVITDSQLRPLYNTGSAVAGTERQFQDSLLAPVFTDSDTRLSGMPLRGGYVFFTEDVSSLRRLQEELRQANETISLENEIISREQELIREREGVRERSRLYEMASKEVYPIQRRISFLLTQAEPGTPQFRETIAKILVLMTYVKRKANFCILQTQQEEIPLQELAHAMQETAYYLGYCGMSVTVDVTGSGMLPLQEAVSAYDCCEAVLERLYGRTQDMFVRLSEEGLLLMADTAFPISMFGLPAAAEQKFEDGQLTLRIQIGGGRQ